MAIAQPHGRRGRFILKADGSIAAWLARRAIEHEQRMRMDSNASSILAFRNKLGDTFLPTGTAV